VIDVTRLPLIVLSVPCFDRRRAKPFPVDTRSYWLDWSELSPEVVAEIAGILAGPEGKSHSPSGFDSSVVTMSYGGRSVDSRLHKYRKLFREVPDNDLEAVLLCDGRMDRAFRQISFGGDYFEDETGAPITRYEMIKHVSGDEQPIIVGDPKSVLVLGPAAPRNERNWTSEKANRLAQFLDVVHRIRSSAWLQSPPSISYVAHSSVPPEVLAASIAPDDQTMAILAYFRQLHAGDALLTKSVDAYLEHCGDARKAWWVDERRKAFVAMIDARPTPWITDGVTRREIVAMFMYGAGLLHSESKHGHDVALGAFVARHGQQKAVFIFNSCLLDFFRVAVQVYYVIRQDFHHWVGEIGLTGPTRVSIKDLFASYSGDTRSGDS
jgi:hypothetical protein